MVYNLTNNTAIDSILIDVAGQVPTLFPMLLVFEFFVLALGGAFANSRRVGYTNISMWFAISGLVTTTTAFLLMSAGGLINLATLSISVAVTLACVLWFFFTDDNP